MPSSNNQLLSLHGSTPQLLGRTTAAQTFNSSTTGSNTGSIEVFVVRVGAGARMGPIFAYLFKHGLMMEGATCAAVGIAGSTQGE